MKYSISNWIYGEENIVETIRRIKKFGYSGIELKGDPNIVECEDLNDLCESEGIAVTGIAGIFPWPTDDRDLSSPDKKIRDKAINYVKFCCDLAAQNNTNCVIVVPTPVGKTSPSWGLINENEWKAACNNSWNYAKESISKAVEYAKSNQIFLAIEPINRYETFLVNRYDQAAKMINEVQSSNLKVHLDTFHMNIEEVNISETIYKAREHIMNIHIADSNRQAVGMGHINFSEIIEILLSLEFSGYLTLECLPPLPDLFLASKSEEYQPLRDTYASNTIDLLTDMEESIIIKNNLS